MFALRAAREFLEARAQVGHPHYSLRRVATLAGAQSFDQRWWGTVLVGRIGGARQNFLPAFDTSAPIWISHLSWDLISGSIRLA